MTAQPIEQTPGAWSETAPNYDLFAEQVTRSFAEDAARLVRIGERTRVLDVAAGTGNFSFAAARRGATVLATDFAQGMLDVLQRKAREQGLEGRVETRVMDGQALEIADASFDVVGSIFGLLFFPDHDRGIQEMLRVLIPGGRAVVSTWAPPPRGEMTRILGLAMTAAFPDLLPPSAPQHWMELGDADSLCRRMMANGFAKAHVVELRHMWVFDQIEQFTGALPKIAPPMVAMFASMHSDQRRIFLDTIVNDFRTRQGDGPYAITHEALIAVATKGNWRP
jgi:ubiquinone/menaquinone biosynthesis C-methylase UbiE